MTTGTPIPELTLDALKNAIYRRDLNAETVDLSTLATQYARKQQEIQARNDQREAVALLESAKVRFAESLRSFGIDLTTADVKDDWNEELTWRSPVELFVDYKGLTFATGKPQSLHAAGGPVFVVKACEACGEYKYSQQLHPRHDWLAAIGQFLLNSGSCYSCQEQKVIPVTPDFQQRSPSGKLLVDGHEIDERA